ncbi:endonuclease-reverse transcriptase [Elysia marginata]|uniref:Endonuclease-reverse transcriptase n=1 Tax=Elysia marginata TaxID=1093978 RepID=A0AAV4IEB0_9GAST|nr:endonuclease-reverse transcriptase [Elysia marginata]
MVISREKVIPQIDIKIDGDRVEQVANFTYLGHWITEDGRSDQEVKRRIGMAKNTFSRMSQLLTNRRISFATRSRLTKCYVWSVFLYACETWTLNESLERNIEALEMCLYRRMARISWKEKKKKQRGTRGNRFEAHGAIENSKTQTASVLLAHTTSPKSPEIHYGGKDQREKTTRRINECCEVALVREEWRRTIASNLWQETEQR